MVPIDAVRRAARGVGGAQRRRRRSACSMAEARRLSNLGPLGLLDSRAADAAARRRGVRRATGGRLNEALLLTIEEAGDVVVLREELDRRARRARSPVDRARDRRRVPDAAHVPRTGLAAAARLLRARRARRPFGARARLRPQRGVRPRLQRHRVRARATSSGRIPTPIPELARLARQLLDDESARRVGAATRDRRGARAGRDAARHRHLHDRPRRAASGRRPAHDPPPSRARRADVFGHRRRGPPASSPSATSKDRRRSLAEVAIAARLLGAERVLPLVSPAPSRAAVGAPRTQPGAHALAGCAHRCLLCGSICPGARDWCDRSTQRASAGHWMKVTHQE